MENSLSFTSLKRNPKVSFHQQEIKNSKSLEEEIFGNTPRATFQTLQKQG